jgi:Zinc knuckle
MTFTQESTGPVAGSNGVIRPRITCFKCKSTGHYAHLCPTTSTSPKTSVPVTNYTQVNTVAKNKSMFTRQEIEGADEAQDLYRKIGWPSNRFFQNLLSQHSMTRNCPLTAEDAKCNLLIYGPDLATLNGKTTKRGSQHIPSTVPSHLPAHISSQHHSNITLCLDVFHVQGQRFHHTISRNLNFAPWLP